MILRKNLSGPVERFLTTSGYQKKKLLKLVNYEIYYKHHSLLLICRFASELMANLAITNCGRSLMEPSHLVDALPYLDIDYDENDRRMALQLIENETQIFRPTKNYLQQLPVPDFDVFLTNCLINEHSRMAKKQVTFFSDFVWKFAKNAFLKKIFENLKF